MSLRYKLALAAAAFWVVTALALAGILRRQDARTREAAGANTAGRINNFLFSVLSRSMSGREKGSVLKPILAAMSEVPGFQGAVVADMEGRATWSAGAMPGADEGIVLGELIAAAGKTGSASARHRDGGLVVRLFPAEASCRSCHRGSGPWVGAVATHARIDPTLLKENLREHAVSVFLALGLLLAGTIALLWFLRRVLVEPLSRVAEAFGSASPENLQAARLPPGGKDEIGVLVSRFNGMLNRIAAAEKKIKESEARYRALFEAAEEGILVVDPATGRVVDENPSMAGLLGTAPGESVGMTVSEMGVLEGVAEGASRMLELVPGDEVRYDSLSFRAKDGRRVELECTATGYGTGGRSLIRCNFRDITERKSLQAQLIQSQKMESIGLLAGGVAHDFNNILTAILGYTSFLMKDAGPDHPMAADLLEIQAAGERAAGLTRQLLAFSRKQPFLPKMVDLNALLSSSVKFIGRIIGEDVRLEVNLEADLRPLRADPVQLEQVLMNLAANARDAMPRGGSITIKAQNKALDLEECKMVNESFPGRFIRLSVEDTGTGMEKEVLKRIFDPFFTTKEVGKGTGLGLSVVYGIVKQHAGWVNVYSELGHGTVFHIYLPVQEAPDEEVGPEKGPAADLKGAGQRILLVEDDGAVRGFARRALAANGYAVVDVADAEAAWEAFERERGEFALAFCDTVLPGKSGPELAAGLRLKKPDLRILMTSGYTGARIPKPDQAGPLPFIQKPFSVEAMLRAVRDALAARPGT